MNSNLLLYLLGARITIVFVSRGYAITLGIYTKEIEERHLVMFSQGNFMFSLYIGSVFCIPKWGLLGAGVGHENKILKSKRIPHRGS